SAMRSSPTFNLKQRESMHRLLYTVANYSAAMDGYSASTQLVAVTVPWKVGLSAFSIVTGVGFGLTGLLFLFAQALKLLKKEQ
ncbi:MAG: hypothetical protein J6038_01460, partial [Bacilli bacterium]|nr:hypothetical protein [Bacilli bacterium]